MILQVGGQADERVQDDDQHDHVGLQELAGVGGHEADAGGCADGLGDDQGQPGVGESDSFTGDKTRVLGGPQPENAGSQRLLAAAAKGDRHDRALWTATARAGGAQGNSTALVGSPGTVAQALLDYVDLGVTTILICGYDPVDDAVDSGLFRALLRRHAAAVVVITAPGEPPAGFTATSFTSVSLEPPLVSFCLARTASAWPAVQAADAILATIVCRVARRVPAGDHAIVLATPEIGEHHADASMTPLVYHAGSYVHLGKTA
jgi:Flavin reductase like domain/Luciferase-like monooxygenase